jgi:hypothetical protein
MFWLLIGEGLQSPMPGSQPIPPSFKKLLDTLYEIVVVEKWTGEVKIQLHRGGVRHIRRVLTPEEIEVILVDDKGM